MRKTKYTFSYGETRSANYQSVRADLALEFEVGEDEDPQAALRAVRSEVVACVQQTTRKMLLALVADSERGNS